MDSYPTLMGLAMVIWGSGIADEFMETKKGFNESLHTKFFKN